MGLLIICFGIFTRLIPHFPNFSPEIVFALYIGTKYTKTLAFVSILLMAVISDLLLGWGLGHWAFFTYSALLTIGWIGSRLKAKNYSKKFILVSFSTTIGFWLWTNFGTWLTANLYPHTLTGFIDCYELALPFLINSLAASLTWSIVIVLGEYYWTKKTTSHAYTSKMKNMDELQKKGV